MAIPEQLEDGRSRAAEPRERAEERPPVGTRLTAEQISENVQIAAEEELRRPLWALFWSGLAAGFTISLSFAAAAYLSLLVPESLHGAAVAAGYPLGFIFVVLARQQLFTENTLEPVIPLLQRQDRRTLIAVLRLWAIVLAANLIGTLLMALVFAETPMFGGGIEPALVRVAEEGTSGGFSLVVYRAIFAGWLIALMAWLVASTHHTGAQIALVWLSTAPIAAFGFRHSIAGSAEAFYLAAIGAESWGAILIAFLIPALIGNVIGGVGLVALLSYGQVAPGRELQRLTARSRRHHRGFGTPAE